MQSLSWVVDVMAFTRHLGPVCKGAATGFLVGLASIAMADKGANHVFRILSRPVEWVTWLAQKVLGLSDGSTALMGWLGLGVYWMMIGAFIGWGVSVLLAKGSGDE
jgi:hypothetical protein